MGGGRRTETWLQVHRFGKGPVFIRISDEGGDTQEKGTATFFCPSKNLFLYEKKVINETPVGQNSDHLGNPCSPYDTPPTLGELPRPVLHAPFLPRVFRRSLRTTPNDPGCLAILGALKT